MDNKKLIEALRAECKDCSERGVLDNKCRSLYYCPNRDAADRLEALTVQLVEKDKQLADVETQHRVEYCESAGYDCEVRGQLAAAVECINAMEEAFRSQRQSAAMLAVVKWRMAQKNSLTPKVPPEWVAQIERRFMAGEGKG